MHNTPSTQRRYCSVCQFPQTVCLCSAIQSVHNDCRITILQHPSEVSVAKNTARLLALSLDHCDIVIGESAQDFAHIQGYLSPHAAVLYPAPDSQPLDVTAQRISIEQLILLDGTWKKAYKMWQLTPWLHDLPAYSLANPPNSIYQRKAKGEHQLSTLEACAYALQALEDKPAAPLLNLLKARQQFSRG